MATDVADLLLTSVVAGVVSLVVSVLIPRYIQRRDQRRDEDQKRVYETLRKEMVSTLGMKDGAMLGFGADSSSEEMEEIRVRGVLVPDRHRELGEDIERLVVLRDRLREASRSLSEVIGTCVQGVLDTNTLVVKGGAGPWKNLADILGHSYRVTGQLHSALATGDKAGFGDELRKYIVGGARNLGVELLPEKDPEQMYTEIEPSIRPTREAYMAVAKDLFVLTEAINRGLEEALRTGKAYRRIA